MDNQMPAKSGPGDAKVSPESHQMNAYMCNNQARLESVADALTKNMDPSYPVKSSK